MSGDGVPITQGEFDAQLERYLAALDDPDATLTDDDYVAITRLWNTIQLRRPAGDDERMAAFEARVFPAEVPTVSKALGMELSKGMALYSPERDLWLGGAPHANSMYDVQG
jgi:hypothetical protein